MATKPNADVTRQFVEMMGRFEGRPKIERTDNDAALVRRYQFDLEMSRVLNTPVQVDYVNEISARAWADLAQKQAAARARLAGEPPATTLRNLDTAFGLVPLPKRRVPKRKPPAISAEVYAAMLRFS